MPSLMLRDVPADLVRAVRAYARQHGLSLPLAAMALLRRGLSAADYDDMAARIDARPR